MVEFEYHVKEVPAMAEAGRTLNTEVIWHQDESCLDRTYDLIVVNSSLQYVENWQERLGRICKATGRCLLLTRLPVVERHPSFPAVQTTQGAKILCWMLNRDELLKTVRDSGLTLVREVVSGDPVPVAGAPENAILKGWVFENRKA
jgi:putative methyltransferase (TIGR04325 family)